MLRVLHIVGNASDPALAERLHALAHDGVVETVHLSRQDMARRRQSLRSDRGTELALMLDRDAALANGAVLLLEAGRAVVVALDEPDWLVLRAPDTAQALALGYFAGNMHWKVRFDGNDLCIALEGPRADYLQRLHALLQAGVVALPPAPAASKAHRHDAHHGHDHPAPQAHGPHEH